MRAGFRVFVDANVWYSRTLRDWLGMLYLDELDQPAFTVFWSEDVLAETLYKLRKERPDLDGKVVATLRDRLAGTFETGRVTDFHVPEQFKGADQYDAHVHAAALACDADFLLTSDRHGFPDDAKYEVIDPDSFLLLMGDRAPHQVQSVLEQQIRYWFERTGEANIPERLRHAGCPRFAELIRVRLQSPDTRLS